MQAVDRVELADCLEDAGRKLEQSKGECHALRDIDLFLRKRWESIAESDDREVGFLCCFLDMYLSKTFYNLIGDVPWVADATRAVQIQFYRTIGEKLRTMGISLKQDADGKLHELYLDLGVAYLRAVKELNHAIS